MWPLANERFSACRCPICCVFILCHSKFCKRIHEPYSLLGPWPCALYRCINAHMESHPHSLHCWSVWSALQGASETQFSKYLQGNTTQQLASNLEILGKAWHREAFKSCKLVVQQALSFCRIINTLVVRCLPLSCSFCLYSQPVEIAGQIARLRVFPVKSKAALRIDSLWLVW